MMWSCLLGNLWIYQNPPLADQIRLDLLIEVDGTWIKGFKSTIGGLDADPSQISSHLLYFQTLLTIVDNSSSSIVGDS